MSKKLEHETYALGAADWMLVDAAAPLTSAELRPKARRAAPLVLRRLFQLVEHPMPSVAMAAGKMLLEYGYRESAYYNTARGDDETTRQEQGACLVDRAAELAAEMEPDEGAALDNGEAQRLRIEQDELSDDSGADDDDETEQAAEREAAE